MPLQGIEHLQGQCLAGEIRSPAVPPSLQPASLSWMASLESCHHTSSTSGSLLSRMVVMRTGRAGLAGLLDEGPNWRFAT